MRWSIHQGAIDSILSGLLRPLVDQDLAVVFYDMTTIRAEGLSQQQADVRHFGMSKEGIVARQVMLGVVQTAEGLPLYHQVFDGNTAEVTTLKPIIEKIIKQFPVKRVIAVADRGLLSTDNTDLSPERALSKLRRIQYQQVKINDTAPIAGLSTINQEQSKILSALTIKKPP